MGAASQISYAYGLSGDPNDDITTNLAAPNIGKTFAPGKWREYSGQTLSFNLTNDYFTEFVFVVETINALANKTYRFRLYNDTDAKILDGYTATGTITTIAIETKRYSKEATNSLSLNTIDHM